jgi:predicted nuclease of predicted toxin-antitoxin system
VGAAEASDSEILAYAARAGAVVVTHDLDFGTILAASGEASPSVVIIRSDNLAVDAIASAVLSALVQFENELSLGALLIVDPRRTRVRLLPLQPQ